MRGADCGDASGRGLDRRIDQAYPSPVRCRSLPITAIIAETEASNLTFLVTDQGKAYSAAGFGNWFRNQCRAADLHGCSAHGLRKAAARRLAEAGCTEHEIAAITGHASLREIARYTKAVDQKKLAAAAMEKVKAGTSSVKPPERFDKKSKIS